MSLQDQNMANMSEMTEEEKNLYLMYSEDPELAMAMSLSLQQTQASELEVPEEPAEDCHEEFCTIQFRLPDASKLQRRFLMANKVEGIINYVKKEKAKSNVKLIKGGFPKKALEDP